MPGDNSTNDLETRVEKVEQLAGVEGILPTTRRGYLGSLAALATGAALGRSGTQSVVADNHGVGVIGASGDRLTGLYVTHEYGTTMSVDAIGGAVAGGRVASISGDSYIAEDSDTTDPSQYDGDVVYYTGVSNE